MQDRQLKVISHEDAIEAKKQALVEQAMSTEFRSEFPDIKVDMAKATKIPFAELTALGAAFASLPEAFRTVTQTVQASGEGLYRITDAAGKAIDASALFSFKDGTGLLGSFRDAAGELNQARLHLAGPQVAETVTCVPYDPTSLFIAAALMEINQKLDAIQETQQQMFDYLKNKDKGKLQANLEQLTEVMQSYRFYCNDEERMRSQRNLVIGIRKEAKEAIRHHQLVVIGFLKRAGVIHIDKEVRDKVDSVRFELEQYRVSVYLYAFSTFLDVMLHGNFEEDYLQSLAEKTEDESIGYRQLYTQAYDLIEADANSSVRAMALGGLSGAMGFLSKTIERTPIGDHTQISEALGEASKGLESFSEEMKTGMMNELIEASRNDVHPFIDNIKNISRLYNEPVMLFADEVAVYVLPGDSAQFEPSAA